MTFEEFKTLKKGDEVTVGSYNGVMPAGALNYCGKIMLVYTTTCNGDIILCQGDDKIIGILFNYHYVEKVYADKNAITEEKQPRDHRVGKGYLVYNIIAIKDDKQKKCGIIGAPTKMSDYDGRPLFVGDVVNVQKDIIDNDNMRATFIETVVVIEDEDGAFVCGIKTSYNDNEQDDEYRVIKIVDHSNVMDGAVFNGIKFCRELAL